MWQAGNPNLALSGIPFLSAQVATAASGHYQAIVNKHDETRDEMIFYLVEDLCGFVLNGLDFNLVGRILSLPMSQCLLKPLQDESSLSNISLHS